MKIVTADQMREIEARSETVGVSTDTLMENAGLAVARAVRRVLGPAYRSPLSWRSLARATTERTAS